jgi:multidrug efflux pump subunit AcrB
MRLSQICIERPVFSIVMSLVIVVLGGISLTRLSNRLFPDVDPPFVSVVTVLPGAAPEVVETSVTQVLEDEIIGIEGIKHLTSQSSEEVSAITVQFEIKRNIDVAAADVRDRVARARERLPDDVKEPIVAKADADAIEIMWLNLAGGGLDPIELSMLAETRIKDRLSKLPGVAKVVIGGERRYAIRLWIDHEQLTARGLTIADVADALARENVDVPSGRVEGGDQEFTVRTLGELKTAEQYGALGARRWGPRPTAPWCASTARWASVSASPSSRRPIRSTWPVRCAPRSKRFARICRRECCSLLNGTAASSSRSRCATSPSPSSTRWCSSWW